MMNWLIPSENLHMFKYYTFADRVENGKLQKILLNHSLFTGKHPTDVFTILIKILMSKHLIFLTKPVCFPFYAIKFLIKYIEKQHYVKILKKMFIRFSSRWIPSLLDKLILWGINFNINIGILCCVKSVGILLNFIQLWISMYVLLYS